MSTVTWPGTLTDSSVNSGATLMTYLNALRTLIETTKFDRDALQFPKADICLPVVSSTPGVAVATGTYNVYVKIPSSLSAAFTPTSLQCSWDDEAGAATVDVSVKEGIAGTTRWTMTQATAPDSMASEMTSFSPATMAAGTVLHFVIVIAVATVTTLTIVLFGSCAHRA